MPPTPDPATTPGLWPILRRIIVAPCNGPQVALLAPQAAADAPQALRQLDVLGSETEGMIGYLIDQELMNALSPGTECATLLTRVEVSRAIPPM